MKIRGGVKFSRNQGSAMIVVLLAVLVIGFLGAMYFRSSFTFLSSSEQSSTAKVLQLQTRSMAEIIRLRLVTRLKPILSPGDPNALTDADMAIDFDPPQNAQTAEQKYKIRKVKLECLWEGASDKAIGGVLKACTRDSRIMPKNFRVVFSASIAEQGFFFNYTENFELTFDRATEYSLVIANSSGTVNFGPTTFFGQVGIFFNDPTDANSIVAFRSQAPQSPSVFNNRVVTNVAEANKDDHFKLYGDVAPEFKDKVSFGQGNGASSLYENFDNMKGSAPHSYDPTGTNTYASLCPSNSCTSNGEADEGFHVRLGGDSAHPCNVQAFYYNKNTGTAVTIFDSEPTDDSVFLLGRKTDVVGGGLPSYIAGSASAPADARVCQRMSFLGEGNMVIRSSIQKEPSHNDSTMANVALFPRGDIKIDANTRLTNGNTIQQQRGLGTPWSGSTPSLNIEAALMPVPICNGSACDPLANDARKGNFNVDSSVIAATNATEAVDLGPLKISGLLMSNDAPISRTSFPGATAADPIAVDGFRSTEIVYNPAYRTSAPPGVPNVNGSTQLIALPNSSSFNFESVKDATASLSGL